MGYKNSLTLAAINELFSVTGISFEYDETHGGYRSFKADGKTYKHRQKLMFCAQVTLTKLLGERSEGSNEQQQSD